jgi:hypothetical protein
MLNAMKLQMPALRVALPSGKHWLGSLMLATGAFLYLIAGLSLAIVDAPDGRALAKVPASHRTIAGLTGPQPQAEPLELREVTPDDAVAWNASIPISDLPNPASRPFMLNAKTEADRLRALECLTAAVYYEAAIEPLDGQRAVAQVVLNRVRHPAYPTTVCGVVFEGSQRTTGCQFTFTCDGSLARAPHPALWQKARQVAEEALAGKVYAPVGWSTHYHTNWVVPYWASSLVKAANVGTHIFYRWAGGWGRGPAFTNRHAGAEPAIGKMGRLTSAPAAEEEVSAEGEALAEAGAVPVTPVSDDISQRPVIRRFEPAQREQINQIIAKQVKPGEQVSGSHRWAMTGEGSPSGQAFGKQGASEAAKPATPAPAPATPPAN